MRSRVIGQSNEGNNLAVEGLRGLGDDTLHVLQDRMAQETGRLQCTVFTYRVGASAPWGELEYRAL